MYGAHLHTLPGGLDLLVLQRDGLHTAEATLVLRAGPRFEDETTSGLSHLVEHMLFRGTEAYPSHRDFHWAVEAIGGPLQGSTGRDMSLFGLLVSPRDMGDALHLLAEATLRPTFADLDLERRLVLEELLEERDEQDRDLDLENLSRARLWPTDPLGMPVLGNRESLLGFDTDDVRAFHRRLFHAGNALLVVAGPLGPDEVTPLAARAFQSMRPGAALAARPTRPTRPGPHLVHVEHDASQVEVMLSFRTVGIDDPRAQGVALLQMILGDGVTSRLQWNVCERRALAYSISVGYEPLWGVGILDIEAAAAPEGYLELVREMVETLRDLKERGPPVEELERARHRYRLALEFAMDSASSLVGFHLHYLYGVHYGIAERLRRLDTWTVDSLRALGREMLARSGAALVSVGPAPDLDRRKVEQLLRRF